MLPPRYTRILFMISHKYSLSPKTTGLGGGGCCTRNRPTAAKATDANCWQEIPKNPKNAKTNQGVQKKSSYPGDLFSALDCFGLFGFFGVFWIW